MKRWRIALIATLGIWATACDEAQVSGGETMTKELAQVVTANGERVTQLTNEELAALLPGATLWFINPAHDATTHETFGCDGLFTALGGRVGGRSGRYSVRDGMYSVERNRQVLSRKIFRSSTSDLFLQHVRADGEASGVTPIRIERAPRAPLCSP